MDNKGLVDKLLKASAIINNKSSRGNGNYMVVSSAVTDILTGFKRNSRKEKIMRIFSEEVQS